MTIMQRREKRAIKLLIVVGVAAVLLVFWPLQQPPPGMPIRARMLREVIEYQYLKLGLLPPSDMKDFYSSVLGMRFRSLAGRIERGSIIAKDITVRSETTDKSICLVIGAKFVNDPEPFLYKWSWERDPYGQTRHLLNTITAGTKRWKAHLLNYDTVNNAFPENSPVSMPSLSFSLPHTRAQMRKYDRWLIKMIGRRRFHDGWGQNVLLEFDDSKAGNPVISARSSGPDKKWQTKDDIVLRREANTGHVIFKQGY